ncbi:MAG: PDZ domain-containing protein [Planctomycetota bacterium]|jgi:protein-L-isoaspartate O-methyltransferase
MMIGTTPCSILAGVLLAAVGALAQPPTLSATRPPDARDETACRPVSDLQPRASGKGLESVPSDLSDTGSLWRWPAAEGDTLRLKLRTSDRGTYQVTIRRAVPTTNSPVVSARAWEVPLTREGRESFTVHGPADRLVDLRFDPIALGPGYHVLELKCVASGELLLDCVGLRRTGDATEEIGRPSEDRGQRAFLGVELGQPQEDGVEIRRTVADTAAERAGLEAGDVVVAIDGMRTPTLKEVQDAIDAYRPGDRVELKLLRDGARIVMDVELGRRPEAQRVERAGHVVNVLQVQPGQVIADIGCGSGWLSEAIAEAVGPEGTVYAVEIQERLVRRLHRWSPPNVVPVLSVPEDVSLPADCLDTAMLHDVASHIERRARPRFYQSLTRALRPEGRLVVFGPHGRAEAMLRELRRHGFIPVDGEALAALSPEDLDRRLRDGIVFRRR